MMMRLNGGLNLETLNSGKKSKKIDIEVVDLIL